MKRILVALDGSDHALRALELATDLARKYQADLVLVHVVDSKPLSSAALELADVEYGQVLPPSLPSSVLADRGQFVQFLEDHEARSASIKDLLGQSILDNASRRAREQGVRTVKVKLEHGEPASTILRLAAECEATLIVVGSRGRSDLQSLVLGSVSHKINSLSPVNVITIR